MRELIDMLSEAYLESGRAPLYHWTNPESARYILEKGKITASLFGVGEVCVTRDKNFHFNKNCVRIEIDADKLRHTLKVSPYDYAHLSFGKAIAAPRSEREERIKGDVPISAFKSITLFDNGFAMKNAYWSDQIKKMMANAEAAGIPVTIEDSPFKIGETINESVGALPDFEEAAGSLYLDLPNNGLPSVRTYVRLEAGFDPYGREAPENEDELIMEWCRAKVQEVYYSIFSHRIKDGKIEAWREVTAGPDWEPSHWTHPGIYWCWKKGYAEAYWGDPHNHEGAGTHKFLIHAYLPVDHIDWKKTLMMNSNPDYEEEYEVRVKDNSPVEIIDVEERGPFHA